MCEALSVPGMLDMAPPPPHPELPLAMSARTSRAGAPENQPALMSQQSEDYWSAELGPQDLAATCMKQF